MKCDYVDPDEVAGKFCQAPDSELCYWDRVCDKPDYICNVFNYLCEPKCKEDGDPCPRPSDCCGDGKGIFSPLAPVCTYHYCF